MNPELFNLNGHGYFVWLSYGRLLLAVVIERVMLKKRRARALAQARLVGAEEPARRVRVEAN